MPFRCRTCKVLSSTEESVSCIKKLECDFRRVEVIHLLHADGVGRVMAKKRVRVRSENDEVIEDQLLKLCCDSNAKSPTASAYRPAVTCLACLNNIPAPTLDENDI